MIDLAILDKGARRVGDLPVLIIYDEKSRTCQATVPKSHQ